MRVAMVSAGLHGVGYAISEVLREGQYRVSVSTTQTPENVEAVNAPWLTHHGDLTVSGDSAHWVDKVMQEWGRIDLLVNNLGPYLWDYPTIAQTETRDWNFVLQTNLTVAFELTKAVVPIMRRQGGGAIINLGFVGAGTDQGWALRGAYAVAKSGLASLTRTIALEEQRHGITCAMVCPSDIRGASKESWTPPVEEKPYRDPIGYDVARVVVFLADPLSRNLSGNVIELAPRLSSDEPTIGDTVWVAPLAMHGVITDIRQESGQPLYLIHPALGESAWYPLIQLQSPHN